MEKLPRLMSFFLERAGRHTKYSVTRLIVLGFGCCFCYVWLTTSLAAGAPLPIDNSIPLLFGVLLAGTAVPKVMEGRNDTSVSTEKTTTETVVVTPQEPPK